MSALRLHSLGPRGIGTMDVESLYSYAMRLANSHAVPLGHFLRQVGPMTGQGLSNKKKYADQVHDTRFGGANDAVLGWVAALETATGMRNLSALTYSSFGRLMTGRGSGAMRRQWCPHCLDDDLVRHGDPHLRLLWTVGLVTACPVHGCRLETACQSCGEGRTQTGRRAKRMSMLGPGACGSCGAWLGGRDVCGAGEIRAVAPATDLEICTARQVGRLVAEPLRPDERIAVDEVLRDACARYFGGAMTALARWVGLNPSTVHGWMSGAVVPELSRLVELALKLHIGLRDLVVGNASALPASLGSAAAALEPRRRAPPEPERKRHQIQACLTGPESWSIRGIATDVGISHRDVYYYAGEAARAHAAIRRDQSEQNRNMEIAAARIVAVASLDTEAGELRGLVRRTRDAVAATHPQLTYSDLGNIARQAVVSISVKVGTPAHTPPKTAPSA